MDTNLVPAFFDLKTRSFLFVQEYRRRIPVDPKDFGYAVDSSMRGISIDPDGTVVVTLPIGFRTDGASSPRFAWSIFPPIGKSLAAAAIHDFLYVNHQAGRPWADAVFEALMKEDGVNAVERFLGYWTVRVAGRRHWDMP